MFFYNIYTNLNQELCELLISKINAVIFNALLIFC